MASVPQDDDEFTAPKSTEQTDDWTVRVDIFDVELAFTVKSGDARLVSSSCNCDIESETCRHIAIAEGRVRAVFQDESLAGVRGRIISAPALWKHIVNEEGEVEASDTAVTR